jgi:hypothetical protein
MPLFGKPAFTSDDRDVELEYTRGVAALQQSDFYTADKHLRRAAAGDHASAFYNLMLMHGAGVLSPYNIDFAADCMYKAAAAGHPKAVENLGLLEAADRGGFGTNNLAKFASEWPSDGGLNHILMICGCRFYDVLCRKYGATVDVIAYELDAASTSDDVSVLEFLKRTGIQESFYEGGLNRLIPGSAADQITDGLNLLHAGLKSAGTRDEYCRMVRCTIVGYVISKSAFGGNAEPLQGTDRFFR